MIRRVLRRAIDRFEWNRTYGAGPMRDKIDTRPRVVCLFSRATTRLAAAILAVGFGLAVPVVALVAAPPAPVRVYTMSPGRIGSIVAGVVGLIGAVIGGRALARSAGRTGADNGRRGAIVALVLGPIGLAIGGLVVATAKGGAGTGNGVGGA
jgi:hypothetical protein